MIKHKKAFGPFSTGPFGYTGKKIALMELRTLIARLTLEYLVSFPAGLRWDAIAEMQVHFTVGLGDLVLVLLRRR